MKLFRGLQHSFARYYQFLKKRKGKERHRRTMFYILNASRQQMIKIRVRLPPAQSILFLSFFFLMNLFPFCFLSQGYQIILYSSFPKDSNLLRYFINLTKFFCSPPLFFCKNLTNLGKFNFKPCDI